MKTQRKIEIFSAGCPTCQDTIDLVNGIVCGSCQVEILDMKKSDVAAKAKALGIHAVPAVVVDGKLAGCCSTPGPSENVLRAAGVGVAI